MNSNTHNRVFALDLHPLSFGYALFEGPDDLIDWGIKNFRHGVNAVKVPLDVKLGLLLDQYTPEVVVIREPKTVALKNMAETITALAKHRGIPMRIISRSSAQAAFPDVGRNKYQIASVIAGRYPELSPRLGPRRKVWQAERYSMSIFVAAAIGLATFAGSAAPDSDDDRTLSPLPR